MNKKGFTLVEMLVVVAIIGVIFSIAGYGGIGVISGSKKKSEEVFVNGISTYIDEYITLYGSSLRNKDNIKYEFDKECNGVDCNVEVFAYELESINMETLIDNGFVTDNKFINPVNKSDCLAGLGKDEIPVIRIFKDSDYVYYYYVDLSNTMCGISSENSVINTLSDELKVKVGLN